MRKKWLIFLTISVGALLCACSSERSVENQAYVLVLGVDVDAENMIELTIQIPKIGASTGESGDSGSKDSSYLIVSAKGKNYNSALEALKWSATRELNLSQIKMIVVSEELSKTAMFQPVVTTLAETYHLYTASRFVICQGSAKDFINGHETVLGTRLSDELDAMFDHYSQLGYIPDSKFADIYYGIHSIYSDPLVTWGFSSSKSETKDTPASALLTSDQSMKSLTKTPSSRHYLGAVVIKNGQYAERLDANHTLFTNLLAGNLKSFDYECNGQTFQLTPLERPRTKVDIVQDKAVIEIKLRLSAVAEDSSLEKNEVGPVIEEDISKTIQYCQQKGIEPFGFANKAAVNYLTVQDWLEVDWHTCFSKADVTIEVHVMRADT